MTFINSDKIELDQANNFAHYFKATIRVWKYCSGSTANSTEHNILFQYWFKWCQMKNQNEALTLKVASDIFSE